MRDYTEISIMTFDRDPDAIDIPIYMCAQMNDAATKATGVKATSYSSTYDYPTYIHTFLQLT